MNSNQLATVMSMVGQGSTVSNICKATNISRQTIYKALRALEDSKVARISTWKTDRNGRAVEPVWSLGAEASVPRPRYTSAEKQRLYRERKAKAKAIEQAMAATTKTEQEPA